MIKQKLIAKRNEKGVSQTEIAFYMGLDQSQYCRRENGDIRMTKSEWTKIADFLNVPLSEIYESPEIISIPTPNNNLNSIIGTMQKYIDKLEKENAMLKEEVGHWKKS